VLRRLCLLPGVSGASWAAVALLLALATWQVPGMVPQAGLDPSWRIALHLAAFHGLDFGRDIVFTYGPLGFLSIPLLVTTTTAVSAFAYAAAAQLGLALVVVFAASRTYGRFTGTLLAFLALGLGLSLSDVAVYVAFFAAVWLLERDDTPTEWWLLPLGGALAAFELLVKLNAGIVCLALIALAAWRLPPGRVRAELVLAGSFALSLLVLWVLTGNPVAGLPHWLRESWAVVSGYTDGMALEARGRAAEYVWAAVLLTGAGVLLVTHLLRLPRARAAALLLVVAGYTYASFKEGFVRHDAQHDLQFFGAFGLSLLAFRWRGAARWGALALLLGTVDATLGFRGIGLRELFFAAFGVSLVALRRRGARRFAALALLLGIVIATPVMLELGIWQLYRPVARARAAVDDGRTLAEGGRRRRELESAKAAVRAQLAVPQGDLRLLRGESVDVVPYEISAVWAYGLRWRPEPLLQWYAAYTGGLDRLNAVALERRGAERILRRTGTIDSREPDFDAPATHLALMCHYRELAAGSGWEVLARTRDRCGSARVLATVQARAGETVRVPRAQANEIVYARIRFPRSLAARLESLVFKPLRLPRIDLGGSDFRFILGNADGPLILRIPRSAGLSPYFGAGVSYDSFRIRRVPSPFSVEFHALPIGGGRRQR
jgi:hypothetical protein